MIMLWAAFGVAVAAPAAVPNDPDAAVIAAHEAFRIGDRAMLDRLAAAVGDHPLAPYVAYWRLKLRLNEASDAEVRDFLSRNDGTVLAEQLRREWLKVLAERRDWEEFSAEYPALAGGDSELYCDSLAARDARGDATALAEIRSLWQAPRELPRACDAVEDSAIAAGAVSREDILRRARLLAAVGAPQAAARLAAHLPRGRFPDERSMAAVIRSPLRFLAERRADLRKPEARELRRLAILRLAQNDPRLAASFWDRATRAAFSAAERTQLWAALAVSGARRHLAESIEWFHEAGDALSDADLAWWVRIALREQNWSEVKAAIGRLSPVAREDPAWIYWLGRAERALGAPRHAAALFNAIAGAPTFYGRLAAEELSQPLRLPPQAPPPSAKEIAVVASLPGVQRALALYRIGMRSDATREWIWSVRGLEDRLLLAAAELARRNGLWDRAINTADHTVAEHDFALRYLAPYRDIFAEQARAYALDEPWLLGLVRQESRFVAEARSAAGAIGLMQLMRPTAHWAAKKLGLARLRLAQLSEPEVNAALGSFYLRHVLDEMDGSPVLAAAAYNAGPARAQQWQGEEPLEGAIYAETIPFDETRDYVKKVMLNAVYYAAVLGEPLLSLKARLGVVPARSAGGAVAFKDEPSP